MKKLLLLLCCIMLPIAAQDSKTYRADAVRNFLTMHQRSNMCTPDCTLAKHLKLYADNFPNWENFKQQLQALNINEFEKTSLVNALIGLEDFEGAHALCLDWLDTIDITTTYTPCTAGGGNIFFKSISMLQNTKRHDLQKLENFVISEGQKSLEKLFLFICSNYRNNIDIRSYPTEPKSQSYLDSMIHAFIQTNMSQKCFEDFLILFADQLPDTLDIEFNETENCQNLLAILIRTIDAQDLVTQTKAEYKNSDVRFKKDTEM